MKTVLFLLLYLKGLRLWLGMKLSNKPKPTGIPGSCMLMFTDKGSKRRHGVVGILIPKGKSLDSFQQCLWGPSGWSDSTTLYRIGVKKWHVFKTGLWLPMPRFKPTVYHLYGRDSWGTVNREQILRHPKLKALHKANPGCTIVLVGVRKLWRWHLPPFNKAQSFILVEYE